VTNDTIAYDNFFLYTVLHRNLFLVFKVVKGFCSSLWKA